MTRIAVIDIGTQSVLLLIAEHDGGSRVRSVLQRTAAVRLGEGLAATGTVGDEPLRRLLPVLHEFRKEALAAGSPRIIAVGTRVFRAASNCDRIVQEVAEHAGLDIDVLSEEEESRYGYLGATWAASYGGTVTVLDIGGGSTEIIRGEGTRIIDWRSYGAGAVTCTETECADQDMPALFPGCEGLLRSSRLAGIGGTVTTLAALDLGLNRYEADAVDGHMLAAAAVAAMKRELAGMDSRERRVRVAIDPGRADILPAGAMILDHLLARSGHEWISVHDRGLRFGIVLRELGLV
ncbi:hypothetical protein JXO52_04025 [bacterium]|nr:hypothetical protein [bacterium]